MSEVVPFPDPPKSEERRQRAEEARRAQEEQARADAVRREQRLALLERARAARKGRTKMSAPSERRTVARNLWEILERLETGPLRITKARVLLEAGKAGPEDSTKHLERYALRPGLSEAEEEKRTGRLVQAVQVYVDLARKAAELAGADADEAELDVLQGSRYLADLPADAVATPELRAADAIAEGLRRMTDRLAKKYDLDRYFAECERYRLIPSAYDRGESKMIASAHGSLAKVTLPHILQDKATLAIGRCPGVYLGSVIAGPIVPAIAKGFAKPSSLYDDSGPPFPFTREVRCIPTWDIMLRLGPFGVGNQVVPVLTLQPMTRVKPSFSGFDGPDGDQNIYFSSSSIIGEHNGFPMGGEVHLEPIEMDFSYDPEVSEFTELSYNIALSGRGLASAGARSPKPQIEIKAINLETLSNLLCRPRFFRHFDAQPEASLVWTDERRADEVPEYLGFHEDEAEGHPTVAPEGTLLALLERWLRGDLMGTYIRPLGEPLELELDKWTKWSVEHLNLALKQAEERLRDAIAHPKSKPDLFPPGYGGDATDA